MNEEVPTTTAGKQREERAFVIFGLIFSSSICPFRVKQLYSLSSLHCVVFDRSNFAQPNNMWKFAVRKASPAMVAAAATTTTAVMLSVSNIDNPDESNKNDNRRNSVENWKKPSQIPFTAIWSSLLNPSHATVQCEQQAAAPPSSSATDSSVATGADKDAPPEILEESAEEQVDDHSTVGFQPKATGDYHGLFPARQLWKPALEYPLWYVFWNKLEIDRSIAVM